MKKVVCFGEIMMRLNPDGYCRLIQADQFKVSFAGGEANAAVTLASYGVHSTFVSKLPSHEIGQAAVNALRRYGVDTSNIVRGGRRIGIYYVEKGASQRASKVIYDRENSAIALAAPEEFDWDNIFQNADWFHFTGITPALGHKMVETCEQACQAAKKRGITISCDLNYRAKLWTRTQAQNAMERLCQYVDICIANEEDAKDVFGFAAKETDVQNGRINKEGYCDVARKLSEKFSFSKVAITLRTSISANDNLWAALLYDNGKTYFSKEYSIHIVDRVGGGDSFGGSLIYAIRAGMSAQETIEFATAGTCLKQTIEGDYNLVTVEEVLNLMRGDTSGRVQR